MNNLEEVDPADEARTYRQKSFPRRLSVAVAGSAMHFLLALVLVFVSSLAFGAVTGDSARNWTVDAALRARGHRAAVPERRVRRVVQQLLDDGETPSTVAGLEPGDRIVSRRRRRARRLRPTSASTSGADPGDVGQPSSIARRRRDHRRRRCRSARSALGEAATGVLGLAADEPPESDVGVRPAARRRRSTRSARSSARLGLGASASFFSPCGLGDFAAAVCSADARTEAAGIVGRAPAASASSTQRRGQNRLLSIFGIVRLGCAGRRRQRPGRLLFLLFAVLNIFIGIFNLIPLLPLRRRPRRHRHLRADPGDRPRRPPLLRRRHPAAARSPTRVVLFLVLLVRRSALYLDIANPISWLTGWPTDGSGRTCELTP